MAVNSEFCMHTTLSSRQEQTTGERARIFLIRMAASGFFISYLPAAILKGRKCTGAGLLGTILAFLLLFALPSAPVRQIIFLAAFIPFSIWIADRAAYENHDDPRIVIDEIAGFWTATLLLPREAGPLLAAFILFRTLDTVKPFGIRKIEKLEGGKGVVLDDIASGLAANLLIQTALLVFPK